MSESKRNVGSARGNAASQGGINSSGSGTNKTSANQNAENKRGTTTGGDKKSGGSATGQGKQPGKTQGVTGTPGRTSTASRPTSEPQSSSAPSRPQTTSATNRSLTSSASKKDMDSFSGPEARFTRKGPPMSIREQISSQGTLSMYMRSQKLKIQPPETQRAIAVEPKEPTPPTSDTALEVPVKKRKRKGDAAVVWERRRMNADPTAFYPCLHRNRKIAVKTRDSLSRKQYIELLSRPKICHEVDSADLNMKYKYRKATPSKRLLALALPNKRQLRDSLRENYCVLAPTRIQRLVDTLQEEMFISRCGMSVNVDFADICDGDADRSGLLKPPKKDRLVLPITIRKQVLLWEPEADKCDKTCPCKSRYCTARLSKEKEKAKHKKLSGKTRAKICGKITAAR